MKLTFLLACCYHLSLKRDVSLATMRAYRHAHAAKLGIARMRENVYVMDMLFPREKIWGALKMRKAKTCLTAALTLILTAQMVPTAAIAQNMNSGDRAAVRAERIARAAANGSAGGDADSDVVVNGTDKWQMPQFALKEDLLTQFDTLGYYKNSAGSWKPDGDDDELTAGWTEADLLDVKPEQKVYFGKDYKDDPMPWYICGADFQEPNNLVLFAEHSLVEPMKFEDRVWSADGNSEWFDGEDGKPGEPSNGLNETELDSDFSGYMGQYYPRNYYKTSDVRKTLNDVADPTRGFFTQEESNLMVPTKVRTLNRKALFSYEHFGNDHLESLDNEFEYDLNWDSKRNHYLGMRWAFGDRVNKNTDIVEKPLEFATPSTYPADVTENDLYYETSDKLYLPYAQGEYPLPTVGSYGGTRVGGSGVNTPGHVLDGCSLPLGQSVMSGSSVDSRGWLNGGSIAPKEGDEPLFFVRSPWTGHRFYDANHGTEQEIGHALIHEQYRDCPMVAGNVGELGPTMVGADYTQITLYQREWACMPAAKALANEKFSVRPAFQLDMSNVLFGSMANVAADGGNNNVPVDENGEEIGIDKDGIQTLRMGKELGEVKRVGTDEGTVIEATASQDDVYLVVQAIDSGASDYVVKKGSDNGQHTGRILMTKEKAGDQPGILDEEAGIAGAWAMKLDKDVPVTVKAGQVCINGKPLETLDAQEMPNPAYDGDRLLRVWLEQVPEDTQNLTYAELETTESYDSFGATKALEGRDAQAGEFSFDIYAKQVEGTGESHLASGVSTAAKNGEPSDVDFNDKEAGVQDYSMRFDKEKLEKAAASGYAIKKNTDMDDDFPFDNFTVENVYMFEFEIREQVDNLPTGVAPKEDGTIPVSMLVEECFMGLIRSPRIIAGKTLDELLEDDGYGNLTHTGFYTKESDDEDPAAGIAKFVNIYTAPADIALKIKKVEGGSAEQKPLAGAKFTVYEDTDKNDSFDKSLDKPAKLTDKPQTESGAKALDWPQVTSKDGIIEMHSLVPDTKTSDGDYFIVENAAPAGYQVLGEPIHIRVSYDKNDPSKGVVVRVLSDGKTEQVPSAGGIPTMTVENSKVIALPNSGSAGRLAVVGAGCTLIALAVAAVVFDMRRAGKNI